MERQMLMLLVIAIGLLIAYMLEARAYKKKIEDEEYDNWLWEQENASTPEQVLERKTIALEDFNKALRDIQKLKEEYPEEYRPWVETFYLVNIRKLKSDLKVYIGENL